MSDLPPPERPIGNDQLKTSFLKKKLGPLPVWAVGLIVIVVIAILANSQSQNGDSNGSDSTAQPAESEEAADTGAGDEDESSDESGDDAAAEEAPEAIEESAGGTREEPVPVGEGLVFRISTFGDADDSVWEATVTGPGEDITAAVIEENMFNEPPVDGNVFYGIPFRIVLVEAGKEPLSPWINISWDMFGPSALQIFDGIDASCGVVPGELDELSEIYVGGSLSGYLCYSLPQEEVDAGPLLSAEPDGERIYLATTGSASSKAEPSAYTGDTFIPDGSGEVGTINNPAPIGSETQVTVDTFGDADGSVWAAVVAGPGTDITEAVLAENSFNDPPAEGFAFYGVPFELTLVEAGKEPLAPWLNLTWDVFATSSLRVFDEGCGVTPNEFDDLTEVFVGGTLSGNLCFSLPISDIEAGPLISTDQGGARIYLATR